MLKRIKHIPAAMLVGLITFTLLPVIASTQQASAVETAGSLTKVRTKQSACEKAMPARFDKRCRQLLAVGHRAREYSTDTNENTIFALRSIAQPGIQAETDTWRLASDNGTPNRGISIIGHDDYIGRVTSEDSRTSAGVTATTRWGEMTYTQFKQLRTKGGKPLPTLQRWIQVSCKIGVHSRIEVKYSPGDAEEVMGWVSQYCGKRKLISFYNKPQYPDSNYPCSIDGLNKLRDAGAIVGIKEQSGCEFTPQEMKAGGYGYVNMSLQGKDVCASVKSMHAEGIEVGNMSSNLAQVWRKLVRCNVDFIIAADPLKLRKWLGSPVK